MASSQDTYDLPAAADMHVHLRDGAMMAAVTPTIRQGGVDTVFVMPNLIPPITTPTAALAYKAQLQNLDPQVNYLMSLYLHPDITPTTVHEAASTNAIFGIKSYPAGVTTNSSSGVLSYEQFYPVFEAMQQVDMVLNLHGEAPPDATASPENAITVLNAEAAFLPTLLDLHSRFPKLRIVLEHCTTASAIAAVRSCGPNVVGTITAHHLFLTIDDWAGDPLNYCKPVAKLPSDKRALLEAAFGKGNGGKFFFGSDSAPHLEGAKRGVDVSGGKCAAGVFTQRNAVGFVVEAYEHARGLGAEIGGREVLEGFLGGWGRRFYKLPETTAGRIRVERPIVGRDEVVKDVVVAGGGQRGVDGRVITFRSEKPTWKVTWV